VVENYFSFLNSSTVLSISFSKFAIAFFRSFFGLSASMCRTGFFVGCERFHAANFAPSLFRYTLRTSAIVREPSSMSSFVFSSFMILICIYVRADFGF